EVQPSLAVTWSSGRDGRHWRFQLRPDVKFDDGSPLTSELVAASLRAANPGWSVFAQGDSVAIDVDVPNPSLGAELALARNSIVKRGTAVPNGTGPFRVADWSPGKKLVVIANEEYWRGRPFLNSVEIEFGKSYREQVTALQLGRAEVIEIPSEQARRMEAGGRRVFESGPVELLALVFTGEAQSANELKLRDALALCIDRASIKNVLLGGEGEQAGGILPNWISGYAFLFPSDMNVAKALEERGEVNQAPAWTLSYDAGDPVNQVMAERIALNARDVGLRVQPSSQANGDVRLVRIRLEAMNAWINLKNVAARVGAGEPAAGANSAEALYQAESTLLHGRRIIPLFHVPVNYGLGTQLKGWHGNRDGNWSAEDLWLGTERN